MSGLFFFLLFTVFFNEIKTFHVLFSKHSHDTIRDQGTLKKSTIDSNLFLCGPNDCQIIKKVSISENNTFDCKDDVLMINFDFTTTLRNQTKLTQSSFGYINKESNVITDQVGRSSCRNIKK